MKIAVLGPVTTQSYYGGVALFDEELAAAFQHLGWESVLITSQKNADFQRMGIPVRKINWLNAKEIFEKEQPDIIIGSLQYAKYWRSYNGKAKKIYFLHGFFNCSYYGRLKSELASLYQRKLTKTADYVFANSYFTKMINSQFFQIRTDAVFHLGVSSDYCNVVKEKRISKEPRTILYAGRLVSAKGVRNLIDSMELLQKQGIHYKAYIAGEGPDKAELQGIVNSHNLNITFLGRMSQKELAEYYLKCEIFVSLNPSEPFGIVFPEALLARCKILCPFTGGQIEYLKNLSNTVKTVDESSPISIATGLKCLLSDNIEVSYDEHMLSMFNYDAIASNMVSYLNSEK